MKLSSAEASVTFLLPVSVWQDDVTWLLKLRPNRGIGATSGDRNA
jgi:hypothetical protein